MEDKHIRFSAANEEVSCFLRRVENLSEGTYWITERDLRELAKCLDALGPELRAAQSPETDPGLRQEIDRYIANLRALQPALEKVQCIMLARKAQIEAEKQHLYGVQSWLSAYHQTA